ncbi:MAG: transposase, partial [Pseudomonadota bacterium]
MPWDDITRKDYNRNIGRYPSDITDKEWILIEPLFPPPKTGGRPRTTDLREVINACLYIASS